MLLPKLKIATVVLLAVGFIVAGAAALTVPILAAGQRTAESGPAQEPGSRDADKAKDKGAAGAADLSKVDRIIKKEPAYQSKPKYGLLVFGPEVKDRVWLVLDGDTLYTDKNGNGDLTEDGERVKAPAFLPVNYPSVARSRSIQVGDVSVGGLSHSHLTVSQEEYRRKADPSTLKDIPSALTPEEWQEHVDRVWRQVPDGIVYHVSINLDPKCYGLFGDTKGQRVKHMAWIDRNGQLAFADRPQDAPVVHFGGSLTLYLRPGEKLLRGQKPAATDAFTGAETSFWLGTPGLGAGTFTIMRHDLLPKDVHPVAEIRFPAKEPGGQPVTQRCVFKSSPANAFFFAPVQVPKEVGLGMTKVTMTFDDWKEGRVAPATAEIRVVDPEPHTILPATAVDFAKQGKTPRYCQLAFGPAAKTRIWIAYDGAGLYADRNGDGNLTADERFQVFGEGFEPFEVADVAGSDRYLVKLIRMQLASNSPPRLAVDVEVKGKFQQHGLASLDERSQKRETAPVAHFNGPLAMRIPGGGTQLVRGARPGQLGAAVGTFDDTHSICWVMVCSQALLPAKGKEAHAPKDFRPETVAKWIDRGLLVLKDFPEGAHPVAEVEFPAKESGGNPVREVYELKERC